MAQRCPPWVELLYEWSTFMNTSLLNTGTSGLISLKEPLGVVVTEIYSTPIADILKFIVGIISCGNAVIIVNKSDNDDLLKDICSTCSLPGGILNVVNSQSQDVIDTLKNHQEIAAYFYASENQVVHISSQQNMTDIRKINLNSNEHILDTVMKTKVIYYSTDESFM